MADPVCASIEQDVDILLEFLGGLAPSPFPPGFFDRKLVTSASFYIWLVSTGVLIVSLFLLWLVPRLMGRRRQMRGHKYEMLADREMTIVRGGDSQTVRREITCENVGLKLKNGAVVLQDINYTFGSGQITALMGPSGSGKTSLLTAIAGRANYGVVTGRTLINGIPCDLNRYQLSIGFVPQEDVMPRDCTVSETLAFSANIRLDRFMSQSTRRKIVEDVQQLLGLGDIGNSLIGDENIRGVSGGQRKRVNLGIELVSQPSVLLLDEPTSGLDSGSSMEMMRALRQLADNKHLTIVAVVHQPSYALLSLFDNIVLLCKGGRMAYAGPVRLMQRYFEDSGYTFRPGENAVDVCLDAISGLIESSDISVTAASLPDLWHRKDMHVQQHAGLVAAAAGGDFELPIPQVLPENHGTKTQFVHWAVISFLFPPIVFVPFHATVYRSRSAQYGGALGALLCLIIAAIGAYIVMGNTVFVFGERYPAAAFFLQYYAYAFSTSNLITATCVLGGWGMAMKKRWCVAVPIHFVMANALGPLLLPFFFLFREKLRYAAVLGFGTWMIVFGTAMGTAAVLAPAFEGQYSNSGFLPQSALMAECFFLLFPTIGFSLIAISASRWNRIPSSDRLISPFLSQTAFQFRRALLQYVRDVFGIAFDLVLPMFTGVACGVLSLGKEWTPPLTEVSEWASNATRCIGCQLSLASTPLRVEAMCKMLNLNNDPYPPLSLMACMGLGLTAVTSSLRLFSNKAVFKRESRAGMATEAYYLGRMGLHMLVSLAATFLFCISFYWLVAPHAPFGYLFAVFFLVYLCCSGVGFWTSVILMPSLSGLMAILGVLAFVLFGGSMFVTGVALPPFWDWLNFAFWCISVLSPMRWSYELVVLIIMKPFAPYLRDPTFSYLYSLYGFSYDHYNQAFVALALLAFLLRVIPYVLLVRSEKQ